MSSRIEVRNKYNIIIGWCDDFTDMVQATHLKKGYVGRYVKSSNITYDRQGKIYAYGDATQSLIRDQENNS